MSSMLCCLYAGQQQPACNIHARISLAYVMCIKELADMTLLQVARVHLLFTVCRVCGPARSSQSSTTLLYSKQ
jgi:hypothetical protein